MVLTIHLPLPPKGCSPNEHSHWRIRAKATKEYREAAFMAGFGIHQTPEWEPIRPVRLLATFDMGPSTFGGPLGFTRTHLYRPLDAANAIGSLKAAIDGLVDAGMTPSDSHEWVHWENPILNRKKKDHGGRCGVVLTITQVERS